MRILILIIFVISGLFANICEANKQKIGDNILWSFVGKFDNKVNMCENLHTLYPQMKANECQVVKVTQTRRNELCELFVEVFSRYRIKTSRNECKYTETDKYVEDIKNLPSVLRKYIFNVKSLNEIDTPTSCVAKSSVKYNHQIIDENAVLEKIKAILKKRDDNNESYLEFVKDDYMQKKALRIYRFVGDKMLSDFFKYYNNEYLLDVINNIEESSGYWEFPIEYEVINWSATHKVDWVERYKEIYDSSYITKCYKKSPQDIVTINYKKKSLYGEDKTETKDMTCAELKSQMELFERAIKD